MLTVESLLTVESIFVMALTKMHRLCETMVKIIHS